jgi:mitogen-activated protein kinase 1/3
MAEQHVQVPGRVHSDGRQTQHLFRIFHRYTDLKIIGEGAYGVVVQGKDRATPENVAIKKIILKDPNAPPILTRQQLIYFQSTLREVKILKKLQHENIINIKHAYRMASDGVNMTEIYLIQDLMGPDRYKLIHGLKNPITNEHIAFFTYQIIRGIKYIHSANVIHRDLKSQNILVNSQCDLKICDFGMARVVDETYDHKGVLTEYVTTRWYRAPEIVVDPRCYTKVS